MNRMALMMVPFLACNPMPVDIDFTSGVLDPRITFTRGSGATRVNPAGLIESVGTNVPRFDHDPVTLAPRGLLIEEQRTAVLLQSGDFSHASWGKGNSTLDAVLYAAPDGSITAAKLIDNATYDTHYTSRAVSLSNNTTYTASVYLKLAGRNARIEGRRNDGAFWTCSVDLTSKSIIGSNNTISTAITDVGNGWVKVCVTFDALSGASTPTFAITTMNGAVATYSGDGLGGVLIWHPQVEAGAFATSYIPTTTAAVTRAADSAIIGGERFSRWYNPSEMTFLIEATLLGGSAILSVSDGTNDNRVQAYIGSNTLRMWLSVAGVNVATLVGRTFVPGTKYKIAMRLKPYDVAISINGDAVIKRTDVPLPIVNRLGIGNNNGGSQASGHYHRLRCWPRALSDAQLQAISA